MAPAASCFGIQVNRSSHQVPLIFSNMRQTMRAPRYPSLALNPPFPHPIGGTNCGSGFSASRAANSST
jgi:hypothetical protein